MSKPSLHDYEWAHELYEDLVRYKTALDRIAAWEMPRTGKYWPSGNEMRYGYLYGSRGEQDVIQNIAIEALNKK